MAESSPAEGPSEDVNPKLSIPSIDDQKALLKHILYTKYPHQRDTWFKSTYMLLEVVSNSESKPEDRVFIQNLYCIGGSGSNHCEKQLYDMKDVISDTIEEKTEINDEVTCRVFQNYSPCSDCSGHLRNLLSHLKKLGRKIQIHVYFTALYKTDLKLDLAPANRKELRNLKKVESIQLAVMNWGLFYNCFNAWVHNEPDTVKGKPPLIALLQLYGGKKEPIDQDRIEEHVQNQKSELEEIIGSNV